MALLTAGIVVLLFIAYELAGTNFSARHSQSQLAKQFNIELAQSQATQPLAPPTTTLTGAAPTTPGRKLPVKKGTAAPPVPAVPAPSGVLDRLIIPAIGVDRYVVQGVAEGDLDEGPGHYPGTPLPGQAGNSGIAGHRTTYGAPFFQLNELTAGDRIYLTDTTGTTWVYRVVRQWVVSPDDVAVLAPTRTAVLTLTTCNPRFSAISRLVVRADLVTYLSPGTVKVVTAGPAAQPSRAQPTPASGPTGTAPPSTTPSSASSSKGADQIADTPVISGQAGTAGTGTAAAEWGALALVLWVAVRLGAARRRGWHQALLVTAGAAISLGPLWFTFENVAHLLPANV